jgi:putative N6-adenine-specific DNA methylase
MAVTLKADRPPPDRVREYFAICTKGLEGVLAAEIASERIGGKDVKPGRGSVSFMGDRPTLYRAALEARTAVRLLMPVADGHVGTPEELYDLVRSVEWSAFMSVEQTLSVEAHVRESAITHSGFAALKTKDAVVDQFRDAVGRRPNVDRDHPHLGLQLRIYRDQATLSVDCSGDSMHKRGYRPVQAKAPLNEALAAGILKLAGWEGPAAAGGILADPMCGSGTLPIEAALIAGDIAPGLMREFPIRFRPDFDSALWERLKSDARRRFNAPPPGRLMANDLHPGAVAIARQSAKRAGVERSIAFREGDIADWEPAKAPTMVVVNPPYGERIGEAADLPGLYKSLGTFLKRRCHGASAFVLSGNPELTRHIGLKSTERWVLFNGPIECRLLRYDIF